MANSIDQLTSGVLTQAFTGFDTSQNLGTWQRLGRTSGQTDNQFQTFRNVGDLRPYPQFTQDIENALTVGTVIGSTQRDTTYNVLRTDLVEILAIRSINSGANREVDVQFFPGETGLGLVDSDGNSILDPNRVDYNWAFSPAGVQEGDITSHRNFNFNSTVTLTGLANATALGTDANGRIVVGRGGGNVTETNTFPTAPSVGDIHIQTTDLGAVMTSGFVPVVDANNAQVLIRRYGCTGNNRCSLDDGGDLDGVAYNLVEHGFANLQINTNRGDTVPALGVAAMPLELAWRNPGDGDVWTSIGMVQDSSANGNQRRIRMSIAMSSEFSSRFDRIPYDVELGYRAAAPVNLPSRSAGTYVFGGDDGSGNPDWNQISANSSVTTSDTFQLTVDDTDGYTNNAANRLIFGEGIRAQGVAGEPSQVMIDVDASIPNYKAAPVRLNEGSTDPAITADALVRTEVTEGTTQATFTRVPNNLAWQVLDQGHAYTDNMFSAFNFRVVSYTPGTGTNDGELVVVIEKIVETNGNPRFNWAINIGHMNLPLNVSGHVGGNNNVLVSKGLQEIDFSNTDFILSSPDNGETVVVSSRAVIPGTLDVQSSDGTTIDNATERIRFGTGFTVTGRDAANAVTTNFDDIDHVLVSSTNATVVRFTINGTTITKDGAADAISSIDGGNNWILNHALDRDMVQVQIFEDRDDNGVTRRYQILPDEMVIIDNNNIRVEFDLTTMKNGYAIVTG